MNVQLWALVGVVVGAMLGGLAQIVADYLRARREREHYLRETRRAAYAELIAAEVEGAFRLRHASGLVGDKATDANELTQQFVMDAAHAATRLSTAVASIGLVAPVDTWGAAQELLGAIHAQATDNSDAVRKHQGIARQSFLNLAHRDLGLPSAPLPGVGA